MRLHGTSIPSPVCLAAAGLLLVSTGSVQADDLEISIQVQTGDGEKEGEKVKTTKTRKQPSAEEPSPRPVFKVKRNEQVQVRWKAKHHGKSETLKNVLVHFYVDEEKKAGQKRPPKLGKDVIHEGALTLDFKPGNKATGRFRLKIPQAGAYLIRVETRNLLDQHGHEHYAALDLVVE